MDEGRYRLAEESFGKAFELSENRRLDIEELRLEANVEQVNEDPAWGETTPRGSRRATSSTCCSCRSARGRGRAARGATLDSYGVVPRPREQRFAEAESAFRAARSCSTRRTTRPRPPGQPALATRGGGGRPSPSTVARSRSTRDASAHYDLALLLEQTGRAAEARGSSRVAPPSSLPATPTCCRVLARVLEPARARPPPCASGSRSSPPPPPAARRRAAARERRVAGRGPAMRRPCAHCSRSSPWRSRTPGRGFLLVALLVSIGTAASLFEPWIYRAIVDDIAGVFVAPASGGQGRATRSRTVGSAFRPRDAQQPAHLPRPAAADARRGDRGAAAARRRARRTQAMATVHPRRLLLLVTRLLSELFR